MLLPCWVDRCHPQLLVSDLMVGAAHMPAWEDKGTPLLRNFKQLWGGSPRLFFPATVQRFRVGKP